MAGESMGLDLASQTGQNNIATALNSLVTQQASIKQAVDDFSNMMRAKPMGGGGGSNSGGDDVMNLMDLYYLGYNSYTYNTSSLMDTYYDNDDLVNSFEIGGYLLEYAIVNEKNVGEFFSRIADIDDTIEWNTLETIEDIAEDSDAVDAILDNANAKNAVSISTSALAAIISSDTDNSLITDRVAHGVGFRLGLYSTFSDLIQPDANKRLIAGSPDAISYMVSDPTRAAILLSYPIIVTYILRNELSKSFFLSSSNIANELSTNSSVVTLLSGSISAMKEIVKSPTLMATLADNSTFMNAVSGSADVITALISEFNAVGEIVLGSSVGGAILTASAVFLTNVPDNEAAALLVLESIIGLTVGDPDYESLSDVMSELCSNANAIIKLEFASRTWNAFASRVWSLINSETDYVTGIYSTLNLFSDKFTAGNRIDQDTVTTANSSCSGTGKIYACKLAGWSSNTAKTTLYIGGTSMGTGCREVTTSYGMSDSEVNAIGVGPSTFTESGDARVSVVPYTIVTS